MQLFGKSWLIFAVLLSFALLITSCYKKDEEPSTSPTLPTPTLFGSWVRFAHSEKSNTVWFTRMTHDTAIFTLNSAHNWQYTRTTNGTTSVLSGSATIGETSMLLQIDSVFNDSIYHPNTVTKWEYSLVLDGLFVFDSSSSDTFKADAFTNMSLHGVAIAGIVRSGMNQGIPSVLVTASTSSGKEVSTRSNYAGCYLLNYLPVERWTVSGIANGYALLPQLVTADSVRSYPLEFILYGK